MAGYTEQQLIDRLTAIRKVLDQGGQEVTFPDGSHMRYPDRKEMLAEEQLYMSLLDTQSVEAPRPSSFFVRTSKGCD